MVVVTRQASQMVESHQGKACEQMMHLSWQRLCNYEVGCSHTGSVHQSRSLHYIQTLYCGAYQTWWCAVSCRQTDNTPKGQTCAKKNTFSRSGIGTKHHELTRFFLCIVLVNVPRDSTPLCHQKGRIQWLLEARGRAVGVDVGVDWGNASFEISLVSTGIGGLTR